MNLLTTEDLARMFRLSRKHVQNRVIHHPKFPKPYRVGGALRWNAAEVQKYLEQTR